VRRPRWRAAGLGTGAADGRGATPAGRWAAPLGVGAAPFGAGVASFGVGPAPLGVGPAPLGVGAAPVGRGPAAPPLLRGCSPRGLGRTSPRLSGVSRRGGSTPGSGCGTRSWRKRGGRGGIRCLAQLGFAAWSAGRRISRRGGLQVARRAAPGACRRARPRTGLGRRTVAGSLRLLRRAHPIRLLDEERIRLLSRGGVAVRVDQLDRIGRSSERRVGRLAHRWVSQTGRHGNDEPRGQPSRNPHCVGTGAHSLAVVEGSGSAHRLAYPLAHAPRRRTRA
jgi:hypothetical protein